MKRFSNRAQAGELLAKHLHQYHGDPGALVLALPRGGVPVGFALAKALALPLDVLVARKLGVPGREEFALGAVAAGGVCVLRPEIIDMFDVPAPDIEAAAQRELHEIELREKRYRAGRPPAQLHERTVILVDDGLATGATMLAAVKSVRNQYPARLIVAIPVGPEDVCNEVGQHADELICLRMPDPFHAVSLWYDDFTQVSDAEVRDMLGQAPPAPEQSGNTDDIGQ